MNRRRFLSGALANLFAGQIYLPLISTQPPPPPEPVLPSGLGVGIPKQDIHLGTDDAVLLGKAWHHNWTYEREFPQKQYFPALWSPTKAADRSSYIQNSLTYDADGRVWLLDNEPAGYAIDPVAAATRYREWHQASRQPFVAAGTIVNDAGFDWINAYLDAGGPIGEAWHWHLYPFGVYCPPGYSVSECWWHLLERLLDWNKARGGNRPLIITETNAARPGDVDAQFEVLEQCGLALKQGAVQAIAWFAMRWIDSWANNMRRSEEVWLIDDQHLLTPLGRKFKSM